ncbi:Cyclic di-GMP phosphodiesterase response regulator RpfG [Rubripirellula amarantea]|uniref:Cyclic di-GMP phosphodiesterase response regulator RpfG n=1 Tax=Rubripirellula amarantea TaxID=2527999 RepID=A0A5C5WJI7_9BACT|nr:HD domain-containing phosphohydrolase [Rubripirellula amarantea]TWT50727.1 Cyclic di-GMP phosphodiesterase response regulator RpfG [Rubripirellula amarantea]
MKCKQVSIDLLVVGTPLVAPVMDPRDDRVKLLSAGIPVTQEFINRLKERHIDSVLMSERDLAVCMAFESEGRRTKVPPALDYVQSTMVNEMSEYIDDKIDDQQVSQEIPETNDPLIAQIDRPIDLAYGSELKRQWAIESDRRIQTSLEVFEESLHSNTVSLEPLVGTCHELIERLVEDPDALVALATSPADCNYPSRHGVHLASLALAIGLTMRLDQNHLMDLALGCLIHDVGMSAVGTAFFDIKTPLSHGSIRRLSNHPVKAIDISAKFGGELPELSRLVLYQIHERCDGSGYPRGRIKSQIHPLARIASVADAFIGMVSKRRHRLAIQGYYANVAILNEMQSGKFDAAAVRALLETVSLHPIGTFVNLSNECIGRVLRTGGEEYVKPTIEMWHPNKLDAKPAIVNLKYDETIRIRSARAA